MKIGVLTSGGDAPGMNAAVRSVVRGAHHHRFQVVGIRDGYNGIFARAFDELGAHSVSNVLQRGGTFLGTGRCARFLEKSGRAEAASILRSHGIEALVVVGGNGSYQGAERLQAETGIRVVGIPGSIDNDVGGTDYSIGFDTAINTAMESIDRIRDTAFSLARMFFVEVMGRNSGQIAGAVAIASGAEAVVVPEQTLDVGALARLIDAGFDAGKDAGIIVVAEGASPGGAAGLAEQVKQRTRHTLDERVVVLSYTQRGGAPSAADRLLASRLGVAAIQALLAGQDPCVVGVRGGKVVPTPIADAMQDAPRFDSTIAALALMLAGIQHS
ncbi:MAG: 6-phosphofructokinase [Gammaproteobacteria bacterium]|nr:6-phosphofructokinase [Gammaproteobacteria bacterium]